MHSVLVISEGPPPLGDTVAEGGALRAWGLAKGLAIHGYHVTFAYRSTYVLADNSGDTSLPPGVALDTWDGDSLDRLIENHKVIVMRYAMGEAHAVISRLQADHILVSDSYIPISVEASARQSNHRDELLNYLRLQKSSREASRRADYFLYASQAQLNYYLGYLSGINKLNPVTYNELKNRLFELPYGLDPAERPANLPTLPKQPTLLWYGAFYSWFDMEALVPALIRIKEQFPNFKLLIAGAKNPYNKDPGLLAHYSKTMQALEPLRDHIEHIPWGAYGDRFETYAKASAIITYNHLGLENLLAWRTRLMDYVLSDRPILTNGGDPLGEDLIRRGLAFRVDQDNLATVFARAIQKPPAVSKFAAAAEAYSWEALTEDLGKALTSPTRLTATVMELKEPYARLVARRVRDVILLPLRVARYAKRRGLIRTVKRVIKGH